MVTFARPTMLELLTRVGGDIASRLEGHPFVRRSVEAALGFAVAGMAYTLHGHVDWVRRQQFPQSADADALSTWGDWLEVPRKAGARAQGAIATVGAGTVPVGTLYQDGAGNLYQVLSGAGTAYVVQAVEMGSAQNLGVGETLRLVSPVAGVQPEASVTTALSGGAALEDVEDYRPRVVRGLRTSVFTGAPGDYRELALRQEGITRAWEFPRRMGPGTVTLTFALDGRTSPIPTADDLAALQTAVDAVRPGDMLGVLVVAPIESAITLNVTARGSMTEAEMAQAVRETLASDGALEAPLSMSVLDEALSAVPGEVSHAITSISITERGVTRVVSPAATEIPPTTFGLFTLAALHLTVTP